MSEIQHRQLPANLEVEELDHSNELDQLEFLVDSLEANPPMEQPASKQMPSMPSFTGANVQQFLPMKSLDIQLSRGTSAVDAPKFTLKNNESQEEAAPAVTVPKKVLLNIMAQAPTESSTGKKTYKRLASISGIFNNQGAALPSVASEQNFLEPEVLQAPVFADEEARETQEADFNPMAKVEVQPASPALRMAPAQSTESKAKTESDANTSDSSFDPAKDSKNVKNT